MIASRRALPELVNGYDLGGFFSVVTPIERSNIVLNPSIETNTTGYTGVDGATLTRTTEDQRRGAYSLKVKPGLSAVSGVYYTTTPLTAGLDYAFSLDVNIRGGQKYVIYAFDGSRIISKKPIIGKGYWERVEILFSAIITGAHRLYLAKDGHSSTNEFFTDGWQLESCETGEVFSTTYIDGDQVGFLPNEIAYYWTGTEHASSSVRTSQTRSGGRVVNLAQLGFSLLSIIGLGFSPVRNVLMPLGVLDGSTYQRTSLDSRQFTIVGQLNGKSLINLHKSRRSVENLFNPDLVGTRQPLRMVYQPVDSCGNSIGDLINIDCVYSGGLSGNTDNFNQERLSIQLTTIDPLIVSDGERAKQLNFSNNIDNASWIVKRSLSGTWSAPASGSNGPTIALGNDGALYGSGGTEITRLVNGGTSWTTIGTVTGGTLTAMAVGFDNKLYVGGSFTAISGVASRGVARYDPSTNTWESLSSAFTGTSILAIAFDSSNTLYVGGAFSAIGGITVNGLARRNNTSGTWSIAGTTGTNVGTQVDDIVFGTDGYMYITGSFQVINSVNANRIARYNLSTVVWTAMSTGLNNGGTALAIGLNGLVYVSGNFTQAGGVSGTTGIAAWNGVTYVPLGSGIVGIANDMVVDPNGILYIAGPFTSAGGVVTLSGFARWNGSRWDISDIALPSAAAHMILDSQTGGIYIGYNSPIGTVTAAAITSVPNRGQSITYPIVEFYGTGRLYQLINYTTGRALFFNITLLPNEKALLVTRPGKITFTSNFRGNLFSYITGIDNLALVPGNNNISVLMTGGDSNARVIMRWHETYQSIAGAIR